MCSVFARLVRIDVWRLVAIWICFCLDAGAANTIQAPGLRSPEAITLTITGPTTACEGAVITLTASGADSYSWSTGANNHTVTIAPSPGVTIYTVTGSSASGTAQQTIAITVNESPTVSIAGPANVCAGAVISQTAGGALSYTWSNGTQSNVLVVSPTVNAAYTVTGTDANGCKNAAVVSLTVRPLPAVGILDQTVCSGSQAVMTATALNPAITFTWLPSGITGSALTVSPATPQTFTLIAGRAGCTRTFSSRLYVSPAYTPQILFHYNAVCRDSTIILPVLSPDFAVGGTFETSESLNIDPLTGDVPPWLAVPGTYNVVYSLPASGCTAAVTSTASLVVSRLMKLSLGADISIISGASVTLRASGGTSYTWSPPVNCTDCPSITVSPEKTVRYCVTAGDMNGCRGQACVNILVNCLLGELSLPNAFTPDNDGHNDRFCLQGWEGCNENFRVMIFDRWGEKVYESDDPAFCWDGVYKGKALAPDVYVYSISASFKDVPPVTRKGNITLLR